MTEGNGNNMIFLEPPHHNEKQVDFWFVLLQLGLLVLILSVSAGIFVIGKLVLNLTLPWWTIALSPLWCVLAFLIPGGFLITNIVLLLCDAMLIPWWVWAIAVGLNIVQFHSNSHTPDWI